MEFKDFFSDYSTPNWDYIDSISEFQLMKTCMHSSRFHTEGSPYNHTKLVVKEAINHLNLFEHVSKWETEAILMAALFHDIGKPFVTVFDENKNDWSAPFHAEKGSKVARQILFDWPDIEQREYIVNLIRNHMVMHHLMEKSEEHIVKKLKNFKDYQAFKNSCLLCLFDNLGSIRADEDEKSRGNKYYNYRRLLRLGDKYEIPPIKRESKNGKTTVYILIGLPGSGKSTFSNALAEKEGWTPDRILSRDTTRHILGFCGEGEKYIGTPSEEQMVSNYINEKMIEFAKEGKSFALDNTHMVEKYRDSVKQTLKDYPIYYVFVYVEGPTLDGIISRREKDGFGEKSSDIICGFLEKFEFPRPYEYDELIISKNTDIMSEN